MKQTTIDKLLHSGNIPYDIIRDKIKNNIDFPIFKISEKSYVDPITNEDTKTTAMICTKCSNHFTSNAHYVSNPVCPNCGNKSASYSPTAMPEISDDFVFSGDVKIAIYNGERSELVKYHSVSVVDRTAVTKSDIDIREPFVLDVQRVDGETFYLLREFELYFNPDAVTGEKTLYLNYTYNTIVFGEKEIVNIKNGKKSASTFANTYHRYYSWRNNRCFFADNALLNDFLNRLNNYNVSGINPDVVGNTPIIDTYGIKVEELDNLVSYLKSKKPVSSARTKRQELICDILDNKPEPTPFDTENKSVCYKVIEVDELAKKITIEYSCPACGVVHTTQINKYNSHKEDGCIECSDCGSVVFCKDLVDIRCVEGSERVVNVIQDFNDGVIIYDARYRVSVDNTVLHMTPLTNAPSQVCFIKKDFDATNLMSNVNIVRINNATGEYSLAKAFRANGAMGHMDVYNDATNFNLHWSGVELFNGYFGNNAYSQIDTLTAYVLLYRRYPVLEKMLKEGLVDLVKYIINRFDWSTSTPDDKFDLDCNTTVAALRLSKHCLNTLKKYNDDMVNAFLQLQLLYSVDNNVCETDYQYLLKHNVYPYKVADACRQFGFTVHQVCEYIERVRVAQCVNPTTAMSEWLDYLVACQVIGSDLSDRKVKYPSALRTEHDKVVYKKKIIENEEYEERFRTVTKKYGEKLSYKNKDFVITYPKTLNDLFEEGRVLNHCVGSYGDAIKNGNSIVLFIRKAKEPEKPYFTLEVNPVYNAVTQIGGFSDIEPHRLKHKELLTFIKGWADKNNITYSCK